MRSKGRSHPPLTTFATTPEGSAIRRITRGFVAASVSFAVLLGAAYGAGAAAAAEEESIVVPYRHASGLIVRGPESTLDVPPDLQDAYGLAERISEEHPDDFAHPRIDRDAIQVVLGVVTARGERVLEDLLALRVPALSAILPINPEKLLQPNLTIATVLRTQVRTKPASRSRTTLESIKHAVIDLGNDPRFEADELYQSEVDESVGRVVLTMVRLSDALAEELVDRYGTDLVEIRQAPDRPDLRPMARHTDASPFFGGARIEVPAGGCTNAFSWKSSTTYMMLTAGHCVPGGGSVSTPVAYQGSVASGSRENWNQTRGTEYLPGQQFYRGDIALITIKSGSVSSPWIYVGGADSGSALPVRGMVDHRAQPGDEYCTGGSRSGEICGWKVDKPGVDYKYENGSVIRNAVRSQRRGGWCIRPGDSGGSVYQKGNGGVYAYGITSGAAGGGSDYYGGAFDKCLHIFTDIAEVNYGFPGVLRTTDAS